MNRLEINAALCNLANGEDVEASARTVISFASTLKFKLWAIEITYKKDANPGFRGETEHGSFDFNENEKEETVTKQFGNTGERIGKFKIIREDRGRVRFHHFWASGTGTCAGDRDTDVKEYVLYFNPKTKALLHLGERYVAKTTTIWNRFRIRRFMLRTIFGKKQKGDGIGIVYQHGGF